MYYSESFSTSMCAEGIMSDLTSYLLTANRPVKFHPPKNFKLPKRSFGAQGKDRRSFRTEWCVTYCWLHYDVSKDSAFCHVCMTAEFEKKFLASIKEILLSLLPAICVGRKHLQPLRDT